MRGVYTDYTSFVEKNKHRIWPLANSLKNQAEHFYSTGVVCGHAISDIAHPPNEVLIDGVVLNTLSDLDRVAAYHKVEKPTRYKYAAYIGFWWQREKPFSCKLRDYTAFPELSDGFFDMTFLDLCRSVNEIFITDVMLSLIQRNPSGKVCADHGALFQYMDIQDSLQYFLRYRQYSAQDLELFLKGLDTCPLIV